MNWRKIHTNNPMLFIKSKLKLEKQYPFNRLRIIKLLLFNQNKLIE